MHAAQSTDWRTIQLHAAQSTEPSIMQVHASKSTEPSIMQMHAVQSTYWRASARTQFSRLIRGSVAHAVQSEHMPSIMAIR